MAGNSPAIFFTVCHFMPCLNLLSVIDGNIRGIRKL